MSALVALLRTILGDQFPTGLLVVAGLVLSWHDLRLGLYVLSAAVTWHYLALALSSYGSRDGRPVMTAGRALILLFAWVIAVSVLYAAANVLHVLLP